jgi:hypothetical protein
VLLVSVPYALKASDAETLAGRPASAYLLAGARVGADTGPGTSTTTTTPAKSTKANSQNNCQFTNFVAKFVDTSGDVCDSPIYDANGYIGISTTQPAISLDVRTGSLPQMGIAGNTDYLTFFASDIYGPAIYWDPTKDMRFGKGGVGLYNPYGFVEQMRIQSSTGNVGIGTQTPAAKLEVNGSVQADGNVTIATLGSGLIFPDGTKQTTAGGSITGVTAGTDLTGGGTSGTVTLSLDTTKVPTLAGANSFTGSPNAFTGNVGIGTLTPSSKLDVAGDINFSGNVLYQGSPVLQVPGGLSGNSIALGHGALSNTTGFGNTATGYQALQFNATACCNTANGTYALQLNTTGAGNTATGFGALYGNAGGNDNTASGYHALQNNITGSGNTAVGLDALISNTTGYQNTASGVAALLSNTTGANNIAIGYDVLPINTTGNNNIAIGFEAAYNVSGGNSNNIHIASQGSSGDSGTIRIGTLGTQTSFFAAGVRGVTTGNNDAVPVMIDSAGQLGTVSSSRRFKEDIEDIGAASHDLMRLRPVTFRYKQPFADGSKPIQYGLIAEEVAEVYPDLVAHSADGQIETVKYQVLDSMLLNEVQRQQAEIGRLEQKMDEEHQQNENLRERLAKLETALTSMSRLSGISSVR